MHRRHVVQRDHAGRHPGAVLLLEHHSVYTAGKRTDPLHLPLDGTEVVTDGKREWGTVGVSENIVEASWVALVDSIEHKLFKDGARTR